MFYFTYLPQLAISFVETAFGKSVNNDGKAVATTTLYHFVQSEIRFKSFSRVVLKSDLFTESLNQNLYRTESDMRNQTDSKSSWLNVVYYGIPTIPKCLLRHA